MREAPALLLLGVLGVVTVACLLLLSMLMVPRVSTRAATALISSSISGVKVVAANPYEQSLTLNVLVGNETSLEATLGGLEGLAAGIPVSRGYSYAGCILPGDVINLVNGERRVSLEVLGSVSERLVKCGAKRLNLTEYVRRYVKTHGAIVEVVNGSAILIHGYPGSWSARFTSIGYARFSVLPADGMPLRYFWDCILLAEGRWALWGWSYGVLYGCGGCYYCGLRACCVIGGWCFHCRVPETSQLVGSWRQLVDCTKALVHIHGD